MTVRLAVLADDATGANASAAALAASLGRDVPVYDALPAVTTFPMVLNTQSREDVSRSGLVQTWARRLWEAGVRDFDKRIDTTLRGPAPDELQRLVAALPDTPWIGVVAAYPQAGRITRGGRQYLDGLPLAERMAVDTDDLGTYLFGGEQSCRIVATHELSLPGLAEGLLTLGEPVIFDAEDDADLFRIARVLRRVRRRWSGAMLTVTSGAVLHYYPAETDLHTAIIVGSPTAVNIAQVQRLRERLPTWCWPLEEPMLSERKPEDAVIVLHSGLQPVAHRDRRDLSGQLATAALARLHELAKSEWVPERFILTGGELSQAFLRQSGARGAIMHRLAAPLVGHGRIEGGRYADRELLTKGGMVGQPNLLLELVLTPPLR
ncbi:MAG: hypothetical protein OWU84_00860 [Firmicutes bacterium]|nr:hypothetical protein [Bacillota bacterium]